MVIPSSIGFNLCHFRGLCFIWLVACGLHANKAGEVIRERGGCPPPFFCTIQRQHRLALLPFTLLSELHHEMMDSLGTSLPVFYASAPLRGSFAFLPGGAEKTPQQND